MSMSKEEFLSELEGLLAGLSEQERDEALTYYREYIEDAGLENEAKVLEELGSPRKIAAAVMGQFEEEDGEFTEKGFENPDWEEPAKEVIPVETKADKQRRWIKIGIIACFVLFILPMILRALVQIFGMSLNVVMTVIVLLIGIAVCTVVGIILGVIGVLVGFFLLFWMPAQGLTLIGLGFISLGIGCLGNVLCIRFYGKWLPALLHGASRQLGKLSRRNREGQRNE